MTEISSQDTVSKTQQRLHEILSPDDIEELCEIFQQAKDNKFNPHELRELLAKYNIYFDDDDFEILFLKINTNRDNHCDWDELVSHLLLGFRSDDLSGQKETLNLPIDGMPTVRKVIHRYPVVRIRLCPTFMPDRSVNNASGSYVTASKDGTVIYWTQNFELQRTEKSKNPNLKVSKTWVLDCIPLPDVHIVCTSSIERDLRFYDTTANNFSIRIIISRLPFAVYVMAYWFGETEYIDSRLILGDAGGNVWLLEFSPELRGPFQSKPGTALVQLTWSDLLRGKLPLIRVSEFHRVHKDIVRQVDYSPNLNAIFSAAECRDVSVGHMPAPGLVISDLGVQKTQTIFRMTKGVTCFAFDRENTVIATGGPDCMLRLWNHIMPRKPFAILPGHHCGIIFICLQDDGKKIYTIDRSKLAKVWDTSEQNLLQTFNLFSTAITDRTAITCFYNDNTRDLTIANMKFASVKCCPLLRLDKTDGHTHSRPLSVILYNDLFNSVVTCGLDSYIIVWNLWTGKRETFIKAAHTRMAHGGMLRLEITAACFDPKQQLLLTGARDGTLKIWNFNNGTCVRNLAIDFMCEVTQVFWFDERILAVGWNKHVIEFSDTDENELGNSGKKWDTCHSEDVLAAAVHAPQSLITSSYGGELVLWKLETGQPYRRYDVDAPAARIKIKYEGQTPTVAPASKYSATKARGMLYLRKSYRAPSRISLTERQLSDSDRPTIYRTNKKQIAVAASRHRQVSIVQLPTAAAGHKKTAVHSMICLTTRPCSPEFGTVFVALENGIIQVFSNHYLGGYITCFNAIHMAGDCVTSMTVDKTDRFLITGTALGYIKTWLVCNYCVPKSQIVHINWPELRLQFPFLIRSFFEGRAKRTFRNETELKLCNSYKAHMQPIRSIAFLHESKIVLSASSDATARIWTLGGRYIGTLGSPIKWEELVPSQPVRDGYDFRIPPDIKRCASSTTLRVLKGGQTEDPMSILIAQQKHKDRELKNEVREGQPLITYGNSVEEPILGNNLELPAIELIRDKPSLDSQLPYIPIYSHLDYTKAEIISTPDIPELLKKCKMISFMGKKTK